MTSPPQADPQRTTTLPPEVRVVALLFVIDLCLALWFTLNWPPGMAFVAVNEKAWQRIQTTKSPRFYFDLLRERKNQVNFESAWTPPISLVVALEAALKELDAAGGVDVLVKNAGTLAAMTRGAAHALGLPLLAPNDYGDALTAIKAPEGIEIGKVSKILKTEFKSTVAILQYPAPMLRELKKLSAEVVREESEKTPMARKVHASFTKFQALVGPWDHVAEGAYHQFVAG